MDKSAHEQTSGHRRLVRSGRSFLVLLIAASAALIGLVGCQITYLVKSAYSQAGLLRARVPIETALNDSSISEEHKRKLRLALEARIFAETELGLTPTSNYTSFVQLERPFVTYVVAAAERSELKAYKWWYPVVGSLPYKGFFDPDDAKSEAASLKARGYDTFTRGVSAYSTLGWFSDPLLSSMLNYKDYDLVNTVIHETTHATVYIKSQADFNERLAAFMGNIGAREFYIRKEGPNSPTLKEMLNDLDDERLFSEFISAETRALEKWYEERKSTKLDEDLRQKRLKEIQERFANEVRPRLKVSGSYKAFESSELNNARLLTFRLYNEKLDEFEKVFEKLGRDFKKMLAFCRKLENAPDPEAELSKAAATAVTFTQMNRAIVD